MDYELAKEELEKIGCTNVSKTKKPESIWSKVRDMNSQEYRSAWGKQEGKDTSLYDFVYTGRIVDAVKYTLKNGDESSLELSHVQGMLDTIYKINNGYDFGKGKYPCD